MLILALTIALSQMSGGCTPEMANFGFCSNDGSTIGIGFEETTPGLGGGGDAGNGFWEYGSGGGGGQSPPLSDWERELQQIDRCLDIWQVEIRSCFYDDENGQPVVLDPITISDLAQFTPTPPQVNVDPAGVAVMNLPANFVSEASEQVLEAEILGRWVTVRFTPVQFAFDTGDGHTVTSSHGGASWDATGSPQFTPTATSHVYRARGLVYPSVTVTYEASVNLGGGWINLGTVSATSAASEVRVYEAVTRLIKPEPPG